ncbi:MAG: TetR/AcrR family transcriptional regulator [Paracoccaceae bacterium]
MPKSTAQPVKKPRKRSQRGIEAEEKLLQAANEVFWANGYAGSTIAQFIATSGLSVGSFYHQFADKDELLARGTEGVLEDFRATIAALDMSRATNGTLFALFFRMAVEGRKLVARNRGFYRAMAELAQNRFENFGAMAMIAPQVVVRTNDALQDYADQLAAPVTRETVAHAVQIITMTGLQTELGMGPLLPSDLDAYGRVIARAACGVLGYTGGFDLGRTDEETP